MASYTPGPRVVDPHQTPERPLAIFDGPNCGTLIATVDANEDGLQESEANARLIAAAPELLAACELAIDLFQFGTFDNGVHSPSGESEAEHWAGRCREKMASAIAKAKGTS